MVLERLWRPFTAILTAILNVRSLQVDTLRCPFLDMNFPGVASQPAKFPRSRPTLTTQITTAIAAYENYNGYYHDRRSGAHRRSMERWFLRFPSWIPASREAQAARKFSTLAADSSYENYNGSSHDRRLGSAPTINGRLT
jgi:hypothetical protein